MRFSTSSLFVAASLIALGIWTYVSLSIPRFFAAASIVGAISAVFAQHHRQPRSAAITGFLFVLVPVVSYWSYMWLRYAFVFDHRKSRPFFEDGVIAEGVFYPIIYCMIYRTIASVLSLASCVLVTRLLRFAGDDHGV